MHYPKNINNHRYNPKKSSIEWRRVHPKSLDEDVETFCNWLKATKEETIVRETIIERYKKIIKDICGENSDPLVFGSFATGLCLPTSDIDIGIMNVEGGNQSTVMSNLAEALRSSGLVTDIKVISGARVPLIKFVDVESQINFDIAFSVEKGLQNTETILNYLKKYKKLWSLVMIVKYLLSGIGLNEVYSGGLGSYALVLMCISFFQIKYPADHDKQPLSTLLMNFLQYYGNEFDYATKGISIADSSLFDKKTKGWYFEYQPYLLSIQDPNNSDNDVTRPSFNIISIKIQFYRWFSYLSSQPDNYLKSIIPGIHPNIVANRTRLAEVHSANVRVEPSTKSVHKPKSPRKRYSRYHSRASEDLNWRQKKTGSAPQSPNNSNNTPKRKFSPNEIPPHPKRTKTNEISVN